MEQLQSIGTLICLVMFCFTATGIPWARALERQDAESSREETKSEGKE